MKQKCLVLGLLAALILAASGCGGKDPTPAGTTPTSHPATSENTQTAPAATTEPEATEPPTQTPETEAPGNAEAEDVHVYGGILDRFYALISNGSGDGGALDGEIGVSEAITGLESGEALDLIGYAVQDISGDGIPELLIGAITEREASLCRGSEIFAVYTTVNGEPTPTFEGWSRSRYCYLGEGCFFYQGSGGAMYSILGSYRLSEDGMHLLCQDYYFTDANEASPEGMDFYHNTSGQWDPSASEKLDITGEDFGRIAQELEDRVQSVDLTPFSEYQTSDGNSNGVGALVRAQWAEDGLAGFSSFDEFTADTAQPQSRILFTAVKTVTDFRVLALTLEDVDEAGNISFSTQALYTLDALTPERPLVVNMTFYGSIPCYGISYTDENGVTRCFALELSGEDGSIVLWEF